MAGGNLQDKREGTGSTAARPISSIIWRNAHSGLSEPRFRFLPDPRAPVPMFQPHPVSLERRVYAFWQQHVSTDVVQSRSGMRHTISCSIAAPPSLLLPCKWRRQADHNTTRHIQPAASKSLITIASSAGHDLQLSSPSGFLSPKNEVYPVKIRNPAPAIR